MAWLSSGSKVAAVTGGGMGGEWLCLSLSWAGQQRKAERVSAGEDKEVQRKEEEDKEMGRLVLGRELCCWLGFGLGAFRKLGFAFLI